ncbi:Bax inhibitor-1/YccA family protein [Gordonia sp. PDNC005]|uniref:Bax inhibitor-1/YccA family protein n=1 Tax=unclassified Gordonia (in: high G+C Gram-positive bacteria) TaxID=2657482 RepID=UPI001964E473|nr:Bax inhibitor-1/YccA family protein [Gordonia sp. PDNC005]QRY63323.1 Bax inhibitor-1/YccA family protein [Gordonia sp. PDNC005]
MRESSNPIMRGVVKDNKQQNAGGYATFGTGMAGAGQGAMTYGQQQYGQQYTQPGYQPQAGTRPMTIDDVVTKTAMTLGTVILFAVATYFVISGRDTLDAQMSIAAPIMGVGAIGGLVLVLIATFGRKQDNPAIVLAYAAFEGLFVGAISFVFGNLVVSDVSAGVLIGQAVLGTLGVFVGMLIVYKVGAIRVTPRFTRMITAGIFGVLVLVIGNLVVGFFNGGSGLGLRDGGPIAIIFSLVCIALAAFSFLIDFDSADELIRAGAPAKASWGVALGLTVTLVWLYVEILRLLSYLNSD